MSGDNIIQFISLLEEAIKSRIEVCRAPYYKVDGTIIGNGSQDFTKEYRTYSFSIHGTNAQLIDMPGIEGNEDKFKSIIKSALKKCHLVCYVARESKGIETTTLERIKGYLGNTVEVIGILNIPENPKKEYSGDDYIGEMENRIKHLAAKESNLGDSLLSVIPNDLYAKTISVSALPGLCALALRDDDSTFANSLDYEDNESVCTSLRRLARQQHSFLLHAGQDDLYRISRLEELRNAIDDSCKDTPLRIRRNAILRLLDAIDESYLKPMPEKVAAFKRQRDKVVKDSDRLVRRLKDHRVQMRRNVEHAAKNMVYDYLRAEMLEKIVYPHIERHKGIKEDILNAELKSKKDCLSDGLKNAVVEVIKEEINDYRDRVKKSTESWVDDMSHYMEELSVVVPTFDTEAFDWKEAGDWALSIGGYALSGGSIGLAFGMGNPIAAAIGAFVGGLVGLIMKVVEFFMSDAKRISKAKAKAQDAFENTAWDVWCNVEPSVSDISEALHDEVDKLLNAANAKKESAKLTYSIISKFEKDMRLLHKSISARLN